MVMEYEANYSLIFLKGVSISKKKPQQSFWINMIVYTFLLMKRYLIQMFLFLRYVLK